MSHKRKIDDSFIDTFSSLSMSESKPKKRKVYDMKCDIYISDDEVKKVNYLSQLCNIYNKAQCHHVSQQLCQQGVNQNLARLLLADVYYDGYLTEQNYKKALELYMEGSEEGCITSRYNVGWMYQKGYHVERSYRKAVDLYDKCYDHDNAKFHKDMILRYDLFKLEDELNSYKTKKRKNEFVERRCRKKIKY